MRPITTKQFVQKAISVHGNKYDYSQTVYVNVYTPIEIICSIHGRFFQKPVYHTQRKSGCPRCYRASLEYTEEAFLQKALEQFGKQFSYGLYVGFQNPITINCVEHGSFVSTPVYHLIQNGGCKQCLAQKLSLPLHTWIKRFNEKHHNKYDYSFVKHVRSKDKMVVLCPEHGPFYPTPSNHARGHGCPICACQKYVGGYCEEFFQLHPHKKTEIGVLYIIRLWDNSENFYKIGMTSRTVDIRFKSVLPYHYQTLHETQMTLYEAHLKEKHVLMTCKRYQPKRTFPGWTECLVERPPLSFM